MLTQLTVLSGLSMSPPVSHPLEILFTPNKTLQHLKGLLSYIFQKLYKMKLSPFNRADDT